MADERNTRVNLHVDKSEGNEVIIRHGDALPPEEPAGVKVSGEITGPVEFASKRDPKKETTLVIVRRRLGEIEMLVDEHYALSGSGYQIIGKMVQNPDLAQFGINSNKMWLRAEIGKLLRFTKRFFSQADVYEKLLKSMQDMTVKVQRELSEADNLRGTAAKSTSQTADLGRDFQFSFSLTIPLHEGQPPRKIMVEIFCDVSDREIRFWFESPELAEAIQAEKDDVLNEETKKLNERGFPIMWC